MISTEGLKEEMNVSQCQYLLVKEVQDAFKLGSLSDPIGIACNQPSPYGQNFKALIKAAFIAFTILLLLQILINITRDNAEVKNISFGLGSFSKNTATKIADISLPKDGNLKFTSSVPVDNNWAELNFSLVNSQTDETFNVSQAIEYYHGRDSDGNWSEGGQTKSTLTALSVRPSTNLPSLPKKSQGLS